MNAMPLSVQNVNVHLVDEGSGPPTLFLHGNPDSADLWKGVIGQLRKNFRCLAPDLPGFGRSSAPPDFDYSLQNMATFVDALLAAIGIREPLNLATHDLGTSFGLAWAIKHPDKVRRIAVSNAMFFSDYRWHFWGQVWRTPVVGELSMILMNWLIFKMELRRSSRKLTAEHIRNTYALMSGPMKKMIVRLYRASTPGLFAGWEDDLLALTARVPTCVLWGDCDPYIPSRYAERFGAQQVYHFPDCGHWLPAEASEEVAERLFKFFA
jgi:pimeloyl-ACP methyl ester carboxylesterase